MCIEILRNMSITHLKSALKVKLCLLVQEFRREIKTEADGNSENETLQSSKSYGTYNKNLQYEHSIFSNLYNYMKSAPTIETNVVNIPTRKVKFSRMIRVCLIPCKREFDEIKHLTWYNSNEIRNIRTEATLEMKEFREIHKCTLKYGVCMLYQPSNTNEELIKEMK